MKERKPDCFGCCTGAGNEIPDLHHIYPCPFATPYEPMTTADYIWGWLGCVLVVFFIAVSWTAIIAALIWIF